MNMTRNPIRLCALVLLAGSLPVCAAAPEESSSNAQANKAPGNQGLDVVFVHSCESGQLAHVLEDHSVVGAGENPEMRTTVCTVADFPFRRGEVFVGLYPRPGVNKLWLIDSHAPASSSVPLRVLARLEARPDAFVATVGSAEVVRRPLGDDDEIKILLRFADNQLTIPNVLPQPLAFKEGIQLIMPSLGDSCGIQRDGPDFCGLSLCDIRLDNEEKVRWEAQLERNRSRPQ
jgi:hypothetical protein